MIVRSRNFTIFSVGMLGIPTVNYEEFSEFDQLEIPKRRTVGIREIGTSTLKVSMTFDSSEEQYNYAQQLLYTYGSDTNVLILEEEDYVVLGSAVIIDPANPRVILSEGYENIVEIVKEWCNILCRNSTGETIIKFTFGVRKDGEAVMISI